MPRMGRGVMPRGSRGVAWGSRGVAFQANRGVMPRVGSGVVFQGNRRVTVGKFIQNFSTRGLSAHSRFS